jgi:radical SAM superfamily enzyme YgiQ (UPF0313 family)
VAHIALVNPRFEVSYWGLEHAMPVFGKKANMPVACLPLLAALTPPGHTVTLVDENVEPIDYDRLSRADVVGVTGMNVQRFRMREILKELKARGAFTAVGGPWVSVREDYFGDLADAIFVGEAEETWPRFLSDWKEGRPRRRYEQAERTDMTRVPRPRFDLLKTDRYAFGSVQFSRGCPYQCEFCDIIVTFGRRPRLKTGAQVLAELDALRALGVRMVFVVDDNLIGNKRAIKPLLREVIAWQNAHGYPLIFFTEASLDLAEDPELMGLMTEAHFTAVFIGVESPNEESLREARKLQNVRPGLSVAGRVRAVQRAGLDVWCGMIVGFDHDGPGVFRAQLEFAREARLAHVMLGMLVAIPKTPLYDRLAAEGRLDPADAPEFGTNVIPLRMSRRELRDGYVGVMNRLYDPEDYFARVDGLFLRDRIRYGHGLRRYWRGRPWGRLKGNAKDALAAVGLLARLMWHVPEARLRRVYRRQFARAWARRRDPNVLLVYALKCVMHYHHYTLARQMAAGTGPVPNTF